jgi:DNA-binding MarR family transcriptional regulator
MPKIHEELKQAGPFERTEEAALVTLLRTAEVARHALEAALRPWAVSPEQYNVLRILRGARETGHPTLEIAQRMIARCPNITRMLDKLLAKGLVRRHRDGGDRRVVRIKIAERGLDLLGRCDKAVRGMLDKVGCLRKGEMESLIEGLDRLRERLAVPTVRESLSGKGPA